MIEIPEKVDKKNTQSHKQKTQIRRRHNGISNKNISHFCYDTSCRVAGDCRINESGVLFFGAQNGNERYEIDLLYWLRLLALQMHHTRLTYTPISG